MCIFMFALQMELKECRLRLAEERRARLKAESRLMEVVRSLKKKFNQFHVLGFLLNIFIYLKMLHND